MDRAGLGASMNECMRCWAAILPHVVRHPTLTVDLISLLAHYQARSDGAMYSGCGGGYLYIVSEEQVPGTFREDLPTVGIFLDTGGADVYEDEVDRAKEGALRCPARNDHRWSQKAPGRRGLGIDTESHPVRER